MTVRKLLVIVSRAAIIAVLLAAPLDNEAIVRVEIWLGTTAALIAANLVYELLLASSIEPAQILFAWNWRSSRNQKQPDKRPSQLRAIEALITSAQTNHRAHTNRLSPKLSELAQHFLPITHSVDPVTNPAQAQALLGEVAWLIDNTSTGRSPTTSELNQFLDIIMTNNHPAHNEMDNPA